MHEMSIALALVEQVEDAAARHGQASAVRRIRVEIGELAGVVPDALHFAFELAASGTVLDGAELLTDPIPARARCRACTTEWPPGMPPDLVCPACHGNHSELLAGRELRIVDVAWHAPPTSEAANAATAHGDD